MIHKNRLDVFLTLAETLSYTKVAKKLYMSQQTVSRMINMLEEELGAQLFIRTTRNVELTAAGRRYFDFFLKINREYDDGVVHIKSELNGKYRRTINVGIQSYMDADRIRKAIAMVEAEMPNLRVHVTVGPPSVQLSQFQRKLIDMSIILGRFLPEDLECECASLVTNPLYIMISDKHPKLTENTTYEDLLDLPYISDLLEGEDDIAHNARLKHEMAMWNLDSAETMWTYDRDTALLYAELGYGIVIDTDRSKMVAGRALKMYDTGKTEDLLLIYSKDSVRDDDISAVIGCFREAYS